MSIQTSPFTVFVIAMLAWALSDASHALSLVQVPQSTYTPLDLDACTVLKTYEEGEGVDLRCSGLQDIPIFVSEGDLRFTISYGAPSEHTQHFTPFNTLGKVIEWRLDKEDKPFAAIIRHYLDIASGAEDDQSPKERQVLSISKPGTADQPGCVVGLVDASKNPNANLLARQIADSYARAFRCGVDDAGYVGE